MRRIGVGPNARRPTFVGRMSLSMQLPAKFNLAVGALVGSVLHASVVLAQAPTGTVELYVDPVHSKPEFGVTGFDASIRLRGLPPEGLFSYGVLLSYPANLLTVAGLEDVQLPRELDFNGPNGAGASREIGVGYAAVKGTVDLLSTTVEPYHGEWLATFRLASVNPFQTASGRLEVSIYRTLGNSESVFVTGAGEVLDSGVVLTGGTFAVIPEPGVLGLLALGGASIVLLHWPMGRGKAIAGDVAIQQITVLDQGGPR